MLKICSLPACQLPKLTTTARRAISCAERKRTAFFLSSFSFGLGLSERFSAQTSHLCSAPPLGCGTSRRFERLVWASLHLSERSRTIEVRVTTLSLQICTKSLTQSCLALSAQSILTRLTEYELSGKDPLLDCLSLNRAPKKDRATGR